MKIVGYIILGYLSLFTLSFANDETVNKDLEPFYGRKIPSVLLEPTSVDFKEENIKEALFALVDKSNIPLNYHHEDFLDEIPTNKTITLYMENAYTLEVLLRILKEVNANLFISEKGQLVIGAGIGAVGGNSSKSNKPNSKIEGKIIDAETGEPLPGANVIIKGTSIGAASNIEGLYVISQVPPGSYKLSITYIGYNPVEIPVQVDPGKKIKQNIKMNYTTLEGEKVTITAQAEGQLKAINKQISSVNIKNIISEDRIQEIPEESVAGAIRRLPGVSLRGDRTVIRGLSPHFNQIQIDGVDMASTASNERSSGVGMISQYMVGGIELSKSAMADHEADVIGGAVNLILKQAPEKPYLRLLMQDAFNTLSESYANPKVVLTAGKRYFNNLIGVLGTVSYERGHSTNNTMNASYGEVIIDTKKAIVPQNISLQDKDNLMKNRIGTSFVLDYTTSLTKIKLSSFLSISDHDNKIYNTRYIQREIGNSIDLAQRERIVFNNALRFEQYIGNYKWNAGISYAYSSNDQPEMLSAEIRFPYELERRSYWNMPPIKVPNLKVNEETDIQSGSLMGLDKQTEYTENSQLGTYIDLTKNINIADWLNIDLKMGAKYKHQTKKSDMNYYVANFGTGESDIILSLFDSNIEWMPTNYSDFRPSVNYYNSQFGAHLIVDPVYKQDELLLGDYSLDNMPDEDKVLELNNFLTTNELYWKQMGNSFENDYYGNEDYIAAYIMPQIEIFKKITFIPGLRYERNQTEFTAWRIPSLEENRFQTHPEIANFDVTRQRKNEYFLPMIHGIFRPSDWFDIKTSYTHTLSRPRFGDFVPKWRFDLNILRYNDPYLKPALSKNMDLYFSFYGNKLGLFTIGGYNKRISDLVFDHGRIPVNQLGTANEITKMFDGLPGTEVIGDFINWTINNPEDAVMQGIELEWQTNFWFLPGILKGLVLNVNFTTQKSEVKYPLVEKTQTIVGYDTTTVFGQQQITPIKETVYTDTYYADRMIDQANQLLNLSLGYDYKGFSIRASMKYTDDLFKSYALYDPYREYTTGRYDYDVVIRQKLPVNGLQLFCNFVNLSKTRNITINQGSGWPTQQTYGGIGIALGLNYRL
jgi:hypothetical protein